MAAFKFSRVQGLWLPSVEPKPARLVARSAQSDAARAIRKIYSDLGESLSPQSGLGKMLNNAERAELRLPDHIVTTREAYDAQAVEELAKTLSVLDHHPRASSYLRKLASGALSSYDRGRTVAKDTLWELDACYQMRVAGLTVELSEHPDLIWTDNEAKVGIECKKVHSNARLEKILSEAVAQLEKSTDFGIAAINLDEFVPGTLRVDKWENTDIKPQALLSEFCKTHDRHFSKYVMQNRVAGFLIFCSVRVVLRQSNGRPGLYFTKQWQFFSRPDLPPKLAKRTKALMDAMRRLSSMSK